MDLRQLRSFVMIAQERNFTRAAERLGIAQPPLSRQIHDLEHEFGASLFDRTARPVALTEAGRLLFERATRLLAESERLQAVMRDYASGQRRRFVIGFVGSAIYGPIPALIRSLRDAAPEIDVELIEMNTVAQLRALEDGRIDAGIGRLLLQHPKVARRVLQQEPLVVAVPRSHVLAGDSAPVPLGMLNDETLILYPSEPRPSYADQVLAILGEAAVVPRSTREVRELQTALGLVAAECGVALVPDSIRRLQRPDVHYRAVADPRAVSPIVLSWRTHDSSTAARLLAMVGEDPTDQGRT